MASLTPRHESITGADLSGTDGTTSRTYTLVNSNYYSTIEILVQGSPQHEGTDFSISGGVITFANIIFNDFVISLRYFTSGTVSIVTGEYTYVSTTDIYRTAGITSTEIDSEDVTTQILEAEEFICRLTRNVYWKINLTNQTTDSATDNTITQTSAGWDANDYANQYIWITSGTGINQIRKIESNTSDTITVDRDWDTNPDNTSVFKIFYTPTSFSPYKSDLLDGNGMNYMFLPYYPVKVIESLTIGETPTTVTTSRIYLWEHTGKIQLKSTAEVQKFLNTYPQEVNISYWHGVDHLPYDIKRFIEVRASINILVQQMGGTFDDPSTVGLPEMNLTIGQAYINIEGTVRRLQEEYNQLLTTVKIWPVFG